MKRWGFAVDRRWLSYLAMAVIFAVGCALLSAWQFARREEALIRIERIEQNYGAQPRALGEVLSGPAAFNRDQEWTPVTMTGTYLPGEQLLVRNRPYSGTTGFEVLVPLELADGSVFIVNRGWVPAGQEQDSPDAVPAAPTGTVTVEARLRPGEPTLPGRSAPEGQLATIHLPTVADELGRTTYTGAYGLLVSENPSVARPIAAAEPRRDEGSHFSYALQWIVFGLFGFFGLGYAIRQEYRLRNADDPAEQARAAERDRKASLRAPSDDDIEDALVDARWSSGNRASEVSTGSTTGK